MRLLARPGTDMVTEIGSDLLCEDRGKDEMPAIRERRTMMVLARE